MPRRAEWSETKQTSEEFDENTVVYFLEISHPRFIIYTISTYIFANV